MNDFAILLNPVHFESPFAPDLSRYLKGRTVPQPPNEGDSGRLSMTLGAVQLWRAARFHVGNPCRDRRLPATWPVALGVHAILTGQRHSLRSDPGFLPVRRFSRQLPPGLRPSSPYRLHRLGRFWHGRIHGGPPQSPANGIVSWLGRAELVHLVRLLDPV